MDLEIFTLDASLYRHCRSPGIVSSNLGVFSSISPPWDTLRRSDQPSVILTSSRINKWQGYVIYQVSRTCSSSMHLFVEMNHIFPTIFVWIRGMIWAVMKCKLHVLSDFFGQWKCAGIWASVSKRSKAKEKHYVATYITWHSCLALANTNISHCNMFLQSCYFTKRIEHSNLSPSSLRS